ncbi:MAG TPA: PilT/PilU family type 4a pilus ATPase [Kofleriaceae bacterium]|nr:PilT/PilU family type 4a pilus ATPase [Kofleriaceae bacterium]
MKGLLDHMLACEASDLYITAGSPAVFRIDGVGYPAKNPLAPDEIETMADSLMTPAQQTEFRAKLEMNLALATEDGGRFRANIFRQRGATGMVFRLVRTQIKTLKELNHPPALAELMMQKRGLILVVGGTGSGKSTTLAAMIDHRNRTSSGHIITVEDPVEFIHNHQRCVVTQREVGIDTLSYHHALKNALRQAPDLILIGEIRDAETMEHAITFAETGHLCVATLHANNANQAIERVLNFFPPERAHEIRLQLALNLRAIVSQRLVPTTTGGRAAALEIMLDTPRVRDLIKRGEIEALKDAMEQGMGEGCKTFDGALFDLILANKLDDAEALKAADSPNNLRIRIERYRNKGMEAEQPTLRLAPPPAKLKPVAPPAAASTTSSKATGPNGAIRN